MTTCLGECKKGVTWMSASGPKRTSLVAPHRSAFGGKAGVLAWREIEDLPRIEHRREPALGGDMQRTSGSGRPVEGRHTTGRARKASTARVSTTDLQEQVAALTRELTEAREQLTEAFEYQTATGEVLNVISRSPTDVQPVFDMIAESAARLCEGQFCFVYRFDGQLLHFVAHHSLTPEVLEMNRRAYPAPPSRR